MRFLFFLFGCLSFLAPAEISFAKTAYAQTTHSKIDQAEKPYAEKTHTETAYGQSRFAQSPQTQTSQAKKDLEKASRLFKSLPIQHQGRIKPFDTFARESLREIYGKEHYKGQSAVEILLLLLMVPDIWNQTPLIFVEKEIKKTLGEALKKKYFSFEELNQNQALLLQLSELQTLKQSGEELEPYFQQLEKLQTRMLIFSGIQTGFLIRLEASQTQSLWLSLNELSLKKQESFKNLLSSYASLIVKNMPQKNIEQKNLEQKNLTAKSTPTKDSNISAGASKSTDFLEFQKRIKNFKALLQTHSLISPYKIRAEIFYNSLNPFQKSWIFYLFFLISLILISVFKKQAYFKYTLAFPALAFAFHALGMALRSYIMSRPPVSNMYETVIWVPFVAVIVGFIFYLKGNRWPFIAGATLGFFCLLLSSLAPDVLDGRLQTLEAVLRSSFWLSTHVLTITMSYSFFFLAFVLGDMALISFLIHKQDGFAQKMYQPIYRLIQWGLIFLASGTILGAIWADYSWGRFWGWDPKESWALISLLAYLALLHGKLIGWIKAFNMSLLAVLLFFVVIMAWYGVNFVLGAGLHSYGFGSGGIEYVLGFFLLHLGLGFASLWQKYRLKKGVKI